VKILWQTACIRRRRAATLLARQGGRLMRRYRNLWFALSILVLIALTSVWASDRDEAVLTVQVSAAEHEAIEGYFSLGDTATVMVKPGSDLYKFLSRQRGHSVKITLVENSGRQVSRLGKVGEKDR
jgi:hypothetical protein